jgi:hypothetical protein
MEGGTNLCTRLRNRVCDALTDVMGCCNSKTELEALKSSSVGIKACELRAYDFASESFALDYTEQVQSPSVVGRNPSNGGRTLSNGDSWTPRRTHNVPKDYPSIQAALDAAHEGDVCTFFCAHFVHAALTACMCTQQHLTAAHRAGACGRRCGWRRGDIRKLLS